MSDDLASAFDARIDDLPASVDRAAVRRMRFVACLLDDSVRVPGTDFRIGLDPLLGVLPGAGDAVTGALSLYIVVESARLGVSYRTLLTMLAHVGIDVAGGSIPVVGDFFDAVWKANARNFELALAELADDDLPARTRDAGVEIEIE
jgi:hypothetical protein